MSDDWTVSHLGVALTVRVGATGGRNVAVLLADGDEVARATSWRLGQVTLRHEAHRVQVWWYGLGAVGAVRLIEQRTAGPGGEGQDTIPFAPPDGTRAARWYRWQHAHPRLLAARHAIVEVAVLVATVLGLGALLRALLPRVDLPEIDWPALSLPQVDWPDLPSFRPFGWLSDLLREALAWLSGLLPGWDLGRLGLVWPVLVAVAVGVREVRRRRARDEREARLSHERQAVAGDDGHEAST